jgi:hypothetical protein
MKYQTKFAAKNLGADYIALVSPTGSSRVRLRHHNFGNYVKHLIMTPAATRRTMRNSLYVLEHFQNVFHLVVIYERLFNVRIAYLLAITNNNVFHSRSPY